MGSTKVARDQSQNDQGPTAETRNRRLTILDQDEIDALYGLPRFSDEEREQYFTLTPEEQGALAEFHSSKSKIFFILQLGYFKARRIFFTFDEAEIRADVQYITQHYFLDLAPPTGTVTKKTRLKHQRLILTLCYYRLYRTTDQRRLAKKAEAAARISGKPIFVFRQVLLELEAQRLTIPGYSFLQDLVGQALHFEQHRLTTLLHGQLTDTEIQAMDHLLEHMPSLQHLAQLKREPKDFSNKEIKREIERGDQILGLYQVAQRVLSTLQISNESIIYYSSLVGFYSISRLQRFDPWPVYLYLLCFLHHRYQWRTDILLMSFSAYVRQCEDAARTAARERIYAYRVEANNNLGKAARVLSLFTTTTIAEDAPFHQVRAQAFSILPREQLNHVVTHITSQQVSFDETAFQWEHLEHLGPQFKRYLRPIVSAIEWKGTPGQAPLIDAIHFLQAAFAKGRPLGQYPIRQVPTACLPDHVKRYVCDGTLSASPSHIIPDRYEFCLYRLLQDRLEAGDIYCRDSIRFRSFEDDLIDAQTWRDQKESLMEQTGLSILRQPIEAHLNDLEKELEARWALVNQRIASGENEYIKIQPQRNRSGWNLQYPGDHDDTNHPVFDTFQHVEVGKVLEFVNQQSQFMTAFAHILPRYVKTQADERAIIACLIAWGTNTGLSRMGQISDLRYPLLSTTSDNFIRLETLREANDCVSNAILNMPVFQNYEIGGAIHSSSDGQKFETSVSTINARHSPKYFGLKKGIVAYTLVANHIPINARIIGANEHESHYVFDVLFNNTSQIQPEIHSTDTHGTNHVNFAILHLFGYQFAPRY